MSSLTLTFCLGVTSCSADRGSRTRPLWPRPPQLGLSTLHPWGGFGKSKSLSVFLTKKEEMPAGVITSLLTYPSLGYHFVWVWFIFHLY